MTRPAVLFFLCSFVAPATVLADSGTDRGEAEADAFTRAYADACVAHATDLQGLRADHDGDEALRPELAAAFLGDREGDAWSLDSDAGQLVLVLPEGDTFCAVHVREADIEHARQAFVDLVSEAPDPIEAREREEMADALAGDGDTRVVVWEWEVPDAPLKQRYTLNMGPPAADGRGQMMGTSALLPVDD
ncbi:hypothetical protein [Thioalkalivibrio sp. ALJ24]|uniref:NMCC_0638 family (lipo)protein n=1 Tax=Thioalkalivibrio sp. ALJ24 TaxID=545276 RepID=UPI0003623879|nr:hypothetical protein [Thioalkalivibrio sp. ALJ24]